MSIRTYSELISISDYLERFNYLKLRGSVGRDTFGFDRYINQKFYRSKEWKDLRDYIIVRDNGCDLAHPDYPIQGRIYIHHMNPLTVESIKDSHSDILDPEYCIAVSHLTHNAIHYGDDSLLMKEPNIRSKNDTCPWKR